MNNVVHAAPSASAGLGPLYAPAELKVLEQRNGLVAPLRKPPGRVGSFRERRVRREGKTAAALREDIDTLCHSTSSGGTTEV